MAGIGPGGPWSAGRSVIERGRDGQGLLQHRDLAIGAGAWKIIRDFNNYSIWIGGTGESRGRSGDAVGTVRNCSIGTGRSQKLLAPSDIDRAQTYEFCGPPSLPVEGFQVTMRVAQVVDGDRSFVEWWADFDCDPGRREEVTGTLRSWFAIWLESRRRALDGPVPRQNADHWPTAPGLARFQPTSGNLLCI